MKAIHNDKDMCHFVMHDAFDSSKIQKWKQFTTDPLQQQELSEMHLIVQRYKNESNSQLSNGAKVVDKDAFDSSKIQKWKQFTTTYLCIFSLHLMLLIVQRYKNESNSQLECV